MASISGTSDTSSTISYSFFLGSAGMILFIAITLGIAGDIVLFIVGVILSVLLLLVPNVNTDWLPQISLGRTISIHRPRQSLLGSLYSRLLRVSFFVSMAQNIRYTSIQGAVTSGQLISSPIILSRKIILAFVISLVISGVLSIIGVLLSEPLFLISLLVPVIIRAYPYLSNVLSSSDMSSRYDSDLAYFLAYLQISTISGFGLFDSMMRLVGKNILYSIEKDAEILRKWIKLDGYSEGMAINRLAARHVHKRFQMFLYAYYEISRSNPSGLNDYVSSTADSEFAKITAQDEKRVSKFSNIFMLGSMAMIMAPIMLLVLMFIDTVPDTIQYITLIIFAIPVVFTLFVFVTGSSISDVRLHGNKITILGIVPGVFWYIAHSDILSAVSLAAAVPCIWNGIFVSQQIKRWRSAADGFPIFIRDLIERIKVAANFVASITRVIHGENQLAKYGRFTDIISDIRSRQFMVSDVPQPMFYDGTLPSRRLRMLLFILETVFDGGHRKSLSALERIYRFSLKLNEIKNRADDTLRMSSVLLFAAPPVFFVTMLGMSSMLISFTSNIPDVSHIPNINAESLKLFEKPDYSQVLLALKPAVLIMSVCSGVIVSRIAYSSLVATLPIGICSSIAFVILAGWDVFFDVVNDIVDDFL